MALNFAGNVHLGITFWTLVCLEAKLVIEVDGGQHAAHQEIDAYRTAALEAAGYHVLRFWNHEVLHEMAVVKEVIWRALQTPPPSPPSP